MIQRLRKLWWNARCWIILKLAAGDTFILNATFTADFHKDGFSLVSPRRAFLANNTFVHVDDEKPGEPHVRASRDP